MTTFFSVHLWERIVGSLLLAFWAVSIVAALWFEGSAWVHEQLANDRPAETKLQRFIRRLRERRRLERRLREQAKLPAQVPTVVQIEDRRRELQRAATLGSRTVVH